MNHASNTPFLSPQKAVVINFPARKTNAMQELVNQNE
jgi:hypothetical protein